MATASATATRLDCTDAEYHARDSVSHSTLETFIESPVLYHGRHVLKLPAWQKAPSKALDLGTVLHECFATGKRAAEIGVVPPVDVLTKHGQRRGKAYEAWLAAQDGRVVRTRDETVLLATMYERAVGDPNVARLLAAPGPVETAWEWTDPDTEIPLRFKPDKIAETPDGQAILVDWKSTRHQSPRAFCRDAWQRGYHRQAAFYRRGTRAAGYDVRGMAWVGIGNEPPFEVVVYEIPDRELELGEWQVGAALINMRQRIDNDDWASPYAGTIQPLRFPPYAFQEDRT